MADPLYRSQRNKKTGETRQLVSNDDGASWQLATDAPDQLAGSPEYDSPEAPLPESAYAEGDEPIGEVAPEPSAEPSPPSDPGLLAPHGYDARAPQVAKPFGGSVPAPASNSPAFGYSDHPYEVGARNPWGGGGVMAGLGYALGGMGLDDNETVRMAGRSFDAPVDPRSQYEIGRDTEDAEQAAARAADGFQYGLGQGVTEIAATSPLLATPFAGVPLANAAARAAPMGLRAVSTAAGLEGMGQGMLRAGLSSRQPTAEGQLGDIATGGAVGLGAGAAMPAMLSGASGLASKAVAPFRGAANEARGRMLGVEGSTFSNVARRPGQSMDEGIDLASDGLGAEAERRYGGGMQTAADYARKSGDELDVVGMSVDDAIQRASAEVPDAVPTADFIKLLRGAQAKYKGDASSQGQANFAGYERTIGDIRKLYKGKKYLSPADLQKIKTTHARAGYPTKATKPTPEGQQQLRDQKVAGVARGQLRKTILGDDQNPGLALPETQRAFEGAVADYKKVKTIHDVAAQQATKPAPKLSPAQMAMGGMTGAGIGFGSTGSLVGAGVGAGLGAAAGAVPSAVRAKLPSLPAVAYRGAQHAAERTGNRLDTLARGAGAAAPLAEQTFGPGANDRMRERAPARPYEGAPPPPQPPPAPMPLPQSSPAPKPPPKPQQVAPLQPGKGRGDQLPNVIRAVLDMEPEGEPLGRFTAPLREAIETGDEARIAVAVSNARDDAEFKRDFLPLLVGQQ